MTNAVQTSLGKADTAYQKPGTGIPATDIASGVIPTVPTAYTSDPVMDGTASAGSSTNWAKGDHVHPTDTSRAAVGLGISQATAGQYVKIKTVVNGVPTQFESGEGGSGNASIDLGITGASAGNLIKVSTVDSGAPASWATAVAGTDYQTPYQTTTLTIATSDWNNNVASKTVNGMTATALVLVEFSDTTTVYTVSQSADTLTFTANSAPNENVTVKVGWLV